MNFWILALSYWIHLVATVIWLGGLALTVLVAWPALRRGTLESNQWLDIQKRFLPWANGSLVILLITGFVQMTNDTHYNGFMVLDSIWAWAMLLKHGAYVGMVVISFYLQGMLYPEMTRLALALAKKPKLMAVEAAQLEQREKRLLQVNWACALLVLLFTAVATAV